MTIDRIVPCFVRMAKLNQTNQDRLLLTIISLPLFAGESPLMLTDLTVGTHRIKIIPEGCGRMFRPLSFKFTIN